MLKEVLSSNSDKYSLPNLKQQIDLDQHLEQVCIGSEPRDNGEHSSTQHSTLKKA